MMTDDAIRAAAETYAEEGRTERASMMPPNDVPEANVGPARRTVYSKDPRICKHQFANGRKVCPYCATTNPNL